MEAFDTARNENIWRFLLSTPTTTATHPAHTFFNDGLEYDQNAIYQLPTLHRKCFPSFPTEYTNHALACQPTALRERLSECENIFISYSLFLSISPLNPPDVAEDSRAGSTDDSPGGATPTVLSPPPMMLSTSPMELPPPVGICSRHRLIFPKERFPPPAQLTICSACFPQVATTIIPFFPRSVAF